MMKIGKRWYLKANSANCEKIDECLAYNEYTNLDMKDNNLCAQNMKCSKYRCLKKVEVEQLLNQTVSNLSSKLQISPSLTKMLLQSNGWKMQQVLSKYQENKIEPTAEIATVPGSSNEETCSICLISQSKDNFEGLVCSHLFCNGCWRFNIETKVSEGNSFIMCMENNCGEVALEDFILKHLTVNKLQIKYHQYSFQNFVVCHPQLRFCPGPDCTVIIQSKCWKPNVPIKCSECKTIFCFKCGMNYHAPADCKTFKKWFADTEMQRLTKDCPECRCPINKNNGCEKMKCTNCKFCFCWNCLDAWENHEQNEKCTNYNGNRNVTEEEAQKQMTLLSLRRWYSKWEQRSKSLELVKKAYSQLTLRIKRKTGHGCRSWIDWQYIYPVLHLVTKCHKTLKYSYPKVCYMNAGLEKYLFQFRQKLLEKKLNNLARKIERAKVTDRAEIQYQAMVCEEYRKSLLD